MTLSARDFCLPLGASTKIMGIVNVTPDSFSQDGCLAQKTGFVARAVRQARKMIREGADIVDIGGESTRPGAKRVSVKEEAGRVIPVIAKLAKNVSVPISVDTYKPAVARRALDAGASIVNNIQGVRAEKELLRMVRDYNAAIVLMHMRGTPRTMQRNTVYTRLIDDITASLQKSIEICLEIGIKSDKIIVDPGIGFGKSAEQNLEILHRLKEFKRLGYPVLIGTSRKSFIGQILEKDVQHRLMGTAATVCAAVLNGAHIVRVHDVKAIADTVRVADAIVNQKY